MVLTDVEFLGLICLDSFFRMATRGINSRKNKAVKTGKIIHIEKKYSARLTGITDIIKKYVIVVTNSGKKFFWIFLNEKIPSASIGIIIIVKKYVSRIPNNEIIIVVDTADRINESMSFLL